MKFLSKKVITGLFAGTMALSIGAPASQAATPEKNGYYSIHLASNAWKKWDVVQSSLDNERGILLYDVSGRIPDNQQFAFFPLDGGTYAIVNKNSGKPVTIGDNVLPMAGLGGNSGALKQNNWTGNANEKWYLRDLGSNDFEIVNQGTGKVASYAWVGDLVRNYEYVDLDNANPSDKDRVFHIPAARSTFTVPTLPATGTRPVAPNYTGGIDEQLPQTSESVIVGASLIPCIMVKDSQTNDYTKIHNSPYYTLVKEEYWDKTFSKVIQPGLSEAYSYKTGVSSVDQQKMTDTLSMKFGADFGIKFGDASASLKSEISRTIQTEISTTNSEATEETRSYTATGEPGKATGYTQYQLATKYTLKRADGSIVSDPWVVKNDKITVTRKTS
ncbi:RICIN domain-containing protein [Bacillus pseudomycoides]|uniref:RICIN domain-containing protein n=1 Tax=Bacillus pseudomycoides TaxID=64104 RepID=UPI0009AAEC52|nr:RICIN domain-containing protein [Bacillus pseudomycoides]PDX99426.1 toxin [Bacillus pseudomycoides]PEK73412.1 toxin [Bacillus pseudomycoides]PEN10136.1 toxin [Bacillus pseudomycoides]